ncbi:MAG: hypothetical protein HKN04_10165 [Rhodothermaceae bacterium]|nr:hypothetical protein [Rhodothermaceae bacterium]
MWRFLLAGLLLSGNMPALAQDAAAWLTQPVGEVDVRRAAGGPWIAVDGHLTLFWGDEVRTQARSRAVILMQGGERIALGPERRYHVEEGEEERGLGERVAALASGAWTRLFGRDDPVATGAARATDDDAPILERPRYGYVLSPRPTFRWLAAPSHADGYHIRLVPDPTEGDCLDGPGGGVAVWEVDGVADTTLHYPAEYDALLRGAAYRVEVSRQAAPEDVDWGCFIVATETERAELGETWEALQAQYVPEDSLEITAELIYAALLLDEGYYTDALRMLEVADARQPGDATTARLRAYIYEEAGPPILVSPSPSP